MLLYKTGTCFVKTVPVTSIIILNQRFSQKTHYDVLGLTKNCTTKDVKSAFIKLSKTYHPDKNTGQVSHQKFVRILEAYSILSKPDKRQYYDWELVHGRSSANDNYSSSRQRPVRYSYPDQTIWENRDRSKDKYYREKPYYGIPGVQKFPNGTIALFCVLFACFGGLLQYFAISDYDKPSK